MPVVIRKRYRGRFRNVLRSARNHIVMALNDNDRFILKNSIPLIDVPEAGALVAARDALTEMMADTVTIVV